MHAERLATWIVCWASASLKALTDKVSCTLKTFFCYSTLICVATNDEHAHEEEQDKSPKGCLHEWVFDHL